MKTSSSKIRPILSSIENNSGLIKDSYKAKSKIKQKVSRKNIITMSKILAESSYNLLRPHENKYRHKSHINGLKRSKIERSDSNGMNKENKIPKVGINSHLDFTKVNGQAFNYKDSGKVLNWVPEPGIFCICKSTDDGIRPMIQCDNCKEWYHFECIHLSQKNVPDFYLCPKCELTPK